MNKIYIAKLYSVEEKLCADVVKRYMSLGLEGLLRHLEKNPIEIEKQEVDGFKFIEIIEGCHRTRALYDLGLKLLPQERYIIRPEADIICKIPPKLVDVPVVDQKEWDRYNDTREFFWNLIS